MTTTIDFNDLSNGTIVDNEYSSHGVTISGWTAQGAGHRAMTFDSGNPTGGDWDLETNNLGNVLIISEDGDSHDPDDNAHGGLLRFDFEDGADVKSLTFLDIEEGATIRFYDEHGNLIKTCSAYTPDNGQVVANFDVDGVYRMDVTLHGSGAIDNLVFDAIDMRDGTVEGTSGDDVIDVNYTGDPDGDRVDANDAILAGDIGDDDLIYGFDGDDTIRAGNGNDEVYGGAGSDSVDGGRGDDLIFGGAGDDDLKGGGGRDVVYGGAGNDTVAGSNEDDKLYGDGGNDALIGGLGDDLLKGGAGHDQLRANDGDDTLFGGAGDDVLTTGQGNDVAYGGADADTIKATGGDWVFGGATGNDHDVLDITGQGAYILTSPDGTGSPIADSNGNGFDGCVVFVDADGKPDGRVIEFREIEEIVGDAPLNRSPFAEDDAFGADEDTVTALGSVIANDGDPDGNPLTVTFVNDDGANVGEPVTGSNGGLITINADGTASFDPNGAFEDLAQGATRDTTVDYTISDGNGGKATATVTVTVTGVNDAPVAVDSSYVVESDEAAGDIDANAITDDTGEGADKDVDGDALTVLAVNGATENVGAAVAGSNGGLFIINADGTVDFDANGDFEMLGFGDSVDTTVSYTIVDENGATDTADITFTVSGKSDGTVQGTEGDDIISPDGPFVDADGDAIDSGDGVLPGDEGTDNDLIDALGGEDSIDAGLGDDRIFGGTGLDTIEGGAGNDQIFGGNDDDRITDSSGREEVFGGSGNDFIDVSGPSDEALPDVGYPFQSPDPASGNTIPFPGYDADADPEDDKDIVFGGAGDDRIITGDDNDLIDGGSGSDWISAGFDDDSVRGQSGDDLIEGGEGNDVIEGGTGNDIIYGGLQDAFADLVSFPDDEPDANGFQDLVPENNGDTIFGGDGNDTIFGQDDDDTLYGDAGSDYVDGGVDDDVIVLGDGNDTGIGGQGDDVIEGGAGQDQLIGGTGADALFGGTGSDLFIGGNAGDMVVGGEDEDGTDVDVLDLTDSNVIRVEFVQNDPEAGTVFFNDGSTMTFSEIENVIPCFTPGTMIATPRGERPVEDLKEGDRIITRDNGIQEIAWVGHKRITGQQLVKNPHLTPILIKRGSLGQGLPERDMMVSPNHRMLVASDKTQLYFEETEVLAAAKHMAGASGIHAVDVMATTYIHFMFERHEVVLSNGAWSESFQPGDYSLKGIGNSQRNEIFDLFPELATKDGLEGYQSARKSLKKHEAQLLLD